MVSGGLGFWAWGWWVGVGWAWVVLESLELVGWGWSGLCLWVWSWWVGVGRSRWVLAGIEWVGWGRSVVDGAVGLVGWGWLVMGSQLEDMGAQLGARLAKLGTMLAHPAAYVALFKPMLACGLGGLGLVGRGLCVKVWGWWGGVGQ